jgi:hypothetical protein
MNGTRALVAAVMAVALTSVASAAPGTTKQRVIITTNGDTDGFTLTPISKGHLGEDSGTVDDCCWKQKLLVRDGQSIKVNDPLETFKGKAGTFVLRVRIEWLDAGNGYTVGAATWRMVRGTGAYAHVTGSGRGAAAWLPRGFVSFQDEGFMVSK